MKKPLPKQHKVRSVKIPKIIFKQANMSPEETLQRLDEIFSILFEETSKVFDFDK